MKELPKKYLPETVEPTLADKWESEKVYYYDKSRGRDETFVVDTPPPTVSGSLHIGHVFSYTHTDMVTRYQRMKGKNILYPMGWDDNGLPTERRVQNKFGIRCNPRMEYDSGWKPEEIGKSKGFAEVSRQNFIESCALVTDEDEKVFEKLWRRLGLSVDWRQQYATIDPHCRKISQRSFLDLWEKGFVYQNESPTMWDVDYQTALAQADIEDREKPGAYHDIAFAIDQDTEFIISTTRPELLCSCIAVVAHPEDDRFQKYFGQEATTPLFGAKVPIIASDHADPEKGSGIMMVCTFGDAADVDWWKKNSLPIKQTIGSDGRMAEVDFSEGVFQSENPGKAAEIYGELVGLKVHQARQKIAEILARPGTSVFSEECALRAEPKQITHPVKFYEKGDRPVEFITTRQWFIRILEHKDALLAQGEKVNWHPAHMSTRYSNWVEGLNQDWCISRQRFFGVPFPVWYSVSSSGETEYDKPILASAESLPVDPFMDCPPGFEESQRDQPGGFTGDPDVMDTWATSSLTPQLAAHWGEESELMEQIFPMDVRPQSHEIIRTWAFYTIAKAWMHHSKVPWHNVVISGWILDPDRKKMSKSKGNVVTPENLLDQYSSDAVRYWTARARLGVDTAYDESVFKVGRKLSTKLFNASKFVLGFLEDGEINQFDASGVTEKVDRDFLKGLKEVVEAADSNYQGFDYAGALSVSEQSFWDFCDNYLELVKVRAYGSEGVSKEASDSAKLTLLKSLSVYLRLLAPVMPFVTEEIWSWYLAGSKEGGDFRSIHRSKWPEIDEFDGVVEQSEQEGSGLVSVASEILAQVRFAKSEAQKKLKWPVRALEVYGSETMLLKARAVEGDISRAANLTGGAIAFREGSELKVHITLADSE